MRICGALLLVLAVAYAAPAVASSGERQREAPAVEPRKVAETAAADARARSQTAAQDSIIRHPDPSVPLERRWAWAVQEVARRRLDRAWVAYSVPTALRPGTTWSTGSGVTAVADAGRAAADHVLGAPAGDAVVIFRVARDGEVEQVATRRGAGFGFGRLPVVWLGRADEDESFAQLRRLADGHRNPDVREALVETVGIHRGNAMVPYLAAVLGRDGSNGVRREAAHALGRHPGDEALTALLTAVERDGSEDVRREAVEAIGRMRHPDSVTLLREIAVAAPGSDTRRHAAEALGQGGGDAFESLRLIAIGEEDPVVARQAVESMQSFSAEQAAPVLEQIAWQRGREVVARQAAESLGRFPAPWTVVALDSIARRHPETRVARQAVESLGGYRGVVSDGYLRIIADTHPNPGVRDEARDQLARSRERAPTAPVPDS